MSASTFLVFSYVSIITELEAVVLVLVLRATISAAAACSAVAYVLFVEVRGTREQNGFRASNQME